MGRTDERSKRKREEKEIKRKHGKRNVSKEAEKGKE